MPSPYLSSPIELEVDRIRELSKGRRHYEALAAAEALAVEAPGHRDVLYLIAANQRCLNLIQDALTTLQLLEQKHPRFSLLYQERGHCYVGLRDAPRAIDAFLRGVDLNPALAASWNMLERLYHLTGHAESAAKAAEQSSILKELPPEVVRAGSLFSDGDLSAAESILRTYILNAGNHVEAFRLLGRVQHQHVILDEAELLLEAALKRAPDYRAARLDYVRILIDRQKYPQAQEQIDILCSLEPNNPDCVSLSAAACVGLGRHEQAIILYRQLLAATPDASDLHVAMGHSLQSIGHQKQAIDSYKNAATIRPNFGDAYWSLANLKTYRFSQDDIVQMRAAEASPAVQPADRCYLCFALGKAYEDRNEYEESWQFYERGNKIKRAENGYHPDITESNTRKQIELCTAQFFSARAGFGAPDPDPIFIVGLPRSGSTLIEQILASHTQVEGTRELADVPRIALELQRPQSDLSASYLETLADLSAEDCRELGRRYLADTQAYRRGKPFFIDKMPNNFRHVVLIQLMLPTARIIDVRRAPMACCFSNLKQLFASGQEFSYGIEDVAHYYRSYLELMRHWDAALPGRILRICYEEVVKDLEGSVRGILDFCRLEYEPACVKFHKTERAVSTASSEQVRQPIFQAGLFQWRHYERWLGPLKESLGDALIRYRE